MSEVLTTRLSELEATIERGLATFVEVGQALLEIRDSRLYRDSHGTFEDYCRERWGFNRQRASQLIQASEVSKYLDSPPQNDAQARELAPLKDDPERMVEAWEEASADGAPTAETVREAVGRRMNVHYSSETEEWETPQDLFDRLDREFNFSLDVCALDSSAKCENYFTPQDDGLGQAWTGTCWMNPPYGTAIGRWVQKAWESAEAGATVVCLVPARVDTAWWWDWCRFGEIRFLRGRLRFGGGDTSAPFPSAVVVFPRKPHVIWWEG